MFFSTLLNILNIFKKSISNGKYFILIALSLFVVQFFYFTFNLNFFLFILFNFILIFGYFAFINKYNLSNNSRKKIYIDNISFYINNCLSELSILFKEVDDVVELLPCLSAPFLKEFYFSKRTHHKILFNKVVFLQSHKT
jgi:hypothetical protein